MNRRERRIAAVAQEMYAGCDDDPDLPSLVVDAIERADAAAPNPTVDLVLDVVLSYHDIPDFRLRAIREELAGVLAGRDPWTPGDTPPASGWWLVTDDAGHVQAAVYASPEDHAASAALPGHPQNLRPGWSFIGRAWPVLAFAPMPPAFVPGGAL